LAHFAPMISANNFGNHMMRSTTSTEWCDSHLNTIPESSGLLTAVWACESHELAAFSASKRVRQPGMYIVSNGKGEHYVGSSGDVRGRTTPYLHGVLKPARIIAIVGNGRPLQECEARALERIIIQALWPTAKYDANRDEPYGGRVNLEQYCWLQAAWSCLSMALRPIHPDIARPWIGPEYCHLPLRIMAVSFSVAGGQQSEKGSPRQSYPMAVGTSSNPAALFAKNRRIRGICWPLRFVWNRNLLAFSFRLATSFASRAPYFVTLSLLVRSSFSTRRTRRRGSRSRTITRCR